MGLKVGLVFPGISLLGFGSYGKAVDATWVHHGLCMLSACAKQAGHDVKLFDMRQLASYRDVVTQMTAYGPQVVGISAMSADFAIAAKTARLLKTQVEAPIVIGGAHATLATDRVVADDAFDYVVRGEGEIAFIELLDEVEQGRPGPRVRTGEHPDLDTLPFADRAVFGGHEMSLGIPELPGPLVTIIAGRGCIYNCSFCQPAEREIFGKRVRRRSVSNVIGEIVSVMRAQSIGSLMFHDDCLTEDPDWVLEFCKEYQRAAIGRPFLCQSRADLIVRHPDVLEALVGAGLRMIMVGFESGNDRVLRFLRKGTTAEINLQAARICREMGVRIWANYMLGIPTETEEEIMDTVRMIQTIKPDWNSPSFYTPHLGTDLYEYCKVHNLLLSEEIADRSPHGAKIRGVNYRTVYRALDEALGRGSLPITTKARIAVGRALDAAPTLKRGLRAVLPSAWRSGP